MPLMNVKLIGGHFSPKSSFIKNNKKGRPRTKDIIFTKGYKPLSCQDKKLPSNYRAFAFTCPENNVDAIYVALRAVLKQKGVTRPFGIMKRADINGRKLEPGTNVMAVIIDKNGNPVPAISLAFNNKITQKIHRFDWPNIRKVYEPVKKLADTIIEKLQLK